MDNWMFWILVAPVLLLMLLYYLGFLSAGIGVFRRALRARSPGQKIALVVMAGLVAFAPFLWTQYQHKQADFQADQRAQELAAIPRVDLSTQARPGGRALKFVTVGTFSEADITFITGQHRLRAYSPEEQKRLSTAYRNYRAAVFCHSHSSGKMMSSKVKIPICKDLPDSVQVALDLKEPTLFLINGRATSYRVSNVSVGDMYEARLITPTKDALVDYYEEKFVERPPGITNPFSSGYKLVPNQPRFSRRDFLTRALAGVKR